MAKGLPFVMLLLSMILMLSVVPVSAFPTVSWTYYDDFAPSDCSFTDFTTSGFTFGNYGTTACEITNAETSAGYIQTTVDTDYIITGFQWRTGWGDGDDVPPYTYLCLGDGAVSSYHPTNGVCFRFQQYFYYEGVGGGNPTLIQYSSGSPTTIDSTIGTDNLDNDQEFKMWINGTTLYATVDKNDGGVVFDEYWTISYTPTTSTYAIISQDGANNHESSYIYDTWYIYELPPNLQNITSIAATNIGQTNVTLEGDWTFEDATWIDAYWVIDSVEQNHTNSTVATTHDRTFTGLDKETEYDYQLCTDSDLGNACSSTLQFTTLDRTPPSINIANYFDVGITTASVGGTFLFEDFYNITAYAVLDGVNQTQTLYASGVSQYDKEDFTGLDPITNYTWDWCISYENGEICEGGGTFSTLDYTPPYVNAISEFNTTNHQSEVGATVFYGSYENVTLEYYLDDSRTSEDYYNYNGSSSIYYTDLWAYLDFATTYDYRLDITYIDPNTFAGASDSNWISEYRINGTNKVYQIAFWDSRIGSAGWTALNDRRVTTSDECASLCNRFYGDPSLNNVNATLTHTDYGTIYYADAYISEGQGTCWYIDNNPYDECFIGIDGSYVADASGSTPYLAQEMNQSTPIPRYIEGTTYDFTTDPAEIPYISISGAIDIRGTTATIKGTVFPHDYYEVQPYFNFSGTIYNATLINRTPEYNETLYSQSVTPTYDLTGLSMNTTYNFTFCVEYDGNDLCDIQRSLTTTFEPTFTWLDVDITLSDQLSWDWKFDYNNVHLVEYQWNGTGSWLVAPDGGTKTYGFTGLEPETNYTAYVGYRYKVELGDDYIYVNSTTNTARTYYENAFDDIWDTLLQGSGTAKTLLGFVVLFGIIFLGVGAFGKFNMRMGLVPIMLFVVIGTAIATLMKLFAVGILLLVIIGAVVLAILTGMFKNHDEGGR